MIKSTYGMFSDPDIDLTTQKAELINSAANTKAAQLGSSSDMAALDAFRQANPTASSLDEKMYLNRLAMDKAMSRNDSLLGDIATGVSIGFGDILPQTAAGAWGLVTGSQDAWDYVAKQQAEAEASRDQYSVDTATARDRIRASQAEREASYQGRERTWEEAAGDFASTVGDYITNPVAAAIEASENAADIAAMAAGGGLVGGAVRAGVKTAARNKLLEAATRSTATDVIAGRMALQQGVKKEALDTVMNSSAGAILRNQAAKKVGAEALEKTATKAADKAMGAVGMGYTAYSEGVNNGIQTYQEVMGMDPETLDKSKDFQEFKAANPELSGEDLKKEYARSLGQSTALKSGAVAAAIGKLTGASDAAAKLSKGTRDGILKATGKGAAKEGLEEVGQSGSGQLISNIDVAKADESKDVLEGVGHAAAAGLMSGGLLGGTMGAASGVASSASNFKERSAARAKVELQEEKRKSAEEAKIAEFKKKEEAINKANEELDKSLEAVGGDPTKLKGATLQSKGKRRIVETSDLANPDNLSKAEAYIQEISDTQSTIMQHAMAFKDAGDVDKANTYFEAAMAVGREAAAIEAKINETKGKTTTSSESVANATTPAAQQRTFGSHNLEDFSDEDLHKMTSWKGLTDAQQQKVGTELAVRKLRSATSEVSNMVTKGGYSESRERGMKGIQDYSNNIEKAVKSGDAKAIKNEVEQFDSWVSHQEQKSTLVSRAWDIVSASKRTPEMVKELTQINQTLKNDFGMGSSTHPPIHKKSGSMVSNILKDTQTLVAARDNFKNINFDVKPSQISDTEVDAIVAEVSNASVGGSTPIDAAINVLSTPEATPSNIQATPQGDIEPTLTTSAEGVPVDGSPVVTEATAEGVLTSETVVDTQKAPVATQEGIQEQVPTNVPSTPKKLSEATTAILGRGVDKNVDEQGNKVTAAARLDAIQEAYDHPDVSTVEVAKHTDFLQKTVNYLKEAIPTTSAGKSKEQREVIARQTTMLQKATNLLNKNKQLLEPTQRELDVGYKGDSFLKAASMRTTNRLGVMINQIGSNFQSKKNSVFNHARNVIQKFKAALSEKTIGIQGFHESKLTNEDKQVLKSFVDFHDEVAPHIEANFIQLLPTDKYAYQSWVQEFIDETGKVDPDVVTAVAAGMYEYLCTEATSTLYNTSVDVGQMFQLAAKKGAFVPTDENKRVIPPAALSEFGRYKGQPLSWIQSNMGKSVFNHLGLKTHKGSEVSAKEALTAALGIIGTASLQRYNSALPKGQKILTEHSVRASDIQKLLYGGYTTTLDANAQVNMVSFGLPDEEGKNQLATRVESLAAINKLSRKLIPSLFDAPRSRPEPSLTPPAPIKRGTKLQGSDAEMPDGAVDTLNKVQAEPWQVRAPFNNVAQFLGRDNLIALFTADIPEDSTSLLTPLKITADAQRKKITEDVDSAFDFVEYLRQSKDGAFKDGRFYLNPVQWQNHRYGFTNNINPQGTQVHNNWFGMKSWNKTFSVDNQTEVDDFTLFIGAGFGIDTETQTPSQAIEAIETVLVRDDVVEVLSILQDLSKFDDADYEDVQAAQAKIVEVLATFKDPRYALASLSTFAEYQANAEDTFTYNLYIGLDGKTNGNANLITQMPASDVDKQNRQMDRVGLYSDGVTETFADWKANPANKDSYENLLDEWREALGNFVTSEQMESMIAITGAFSRNATKPLVMLSGYSAGDASLFKGFLTNYVVPAYYQELQAAINKNDVDAANSLMYHMGIISGIQHSLVTEGDVSSGLIKVGNFTYRLTEEAMGKHSLYEVTPFVLNGMFTQLSQLHQGALNALDTEFGETFEARTQLQTLVNFVGMVYTLKYEQALADKRKEKYDIFKETNPYTSITEAQFIASTELTYADIEAIKDELRPYLPSINTPVTNGDLKQQLPLIDKSTSPADAKLNNPYRASVRVSRSINGKPTSANAAGKQDTFAPKGAGVFAAAIQAQDSATMVMAQNQVPATLNKHDDIQSSGANGFAAAQAINEAFDTIMGSHSIPSEIMALMDRVLEAGIDPSIYKQMQAISSDRTHPLNSAMYHITSQMAVVDPVSVSDYVENTRSLAAELNAARLAMHKRITSSNQYTRGKGTNFQTNNQIEISDEQMAAQEDVLATYEAFKKNQGTYGSHSTSSLNGTEIAKVDVTPTSSVEIFEKLGSAGVIKDDAEHTEQLKSTLETIINRALGRVHLTIKEAVGVSSMGAISGLDMTLVNAKQGANPYNPKNASGIRMSSQEVYVHELVHAITAYGIEKNVAARRELKRLWKAAEEAIRSPANAALYATNKDMFDRVFKPSINSQGQVDYLHEFVAYGLSHAPMLELLKGITPVALNSPWIKGRSISEKLYHFFGKLLDLLNKKMLRIQNGNMDKQLADVARRLASIETENRGVIQKLIDKVFTSSDSQLNKYNPYVQKAVAKAIEATRPLGKVGKYIAAPLVPAYMVLNWDQASPVVKHINSVVRKGVNRLHDSNNIIGQEIAHMAYESLGTTESNGALVEARRKAKHTIDKARETTQAAVSRLLRDSFDKNVRLTRKVKESMTHALIKTDAVSLIDPSKGIYEALKVIVDPVLRHKEINALTKRIKQLTNSNFEVVQAENLGYFMVHGKSRLELPRLNANSISKGINNGVVNPQVEVLVDKLASLHAINFTNPVYLKDAGKVIEHELSRGIDENGIAVLLTTLNKAKQDSKENLFKGTEGLMIKGYSTERYDNDVDIQVSTNPNDTALISLGYTREMEVHSDPTFAGRTIKYLYVNPHGGMSGYVTNALSIQGKHRRGSVADLASNQGLFGTGLVQAVKAKEKVDNSAYSVGVLPKAVHGDMRAIPVYDPNGAVVDFRYTMSSKMKENYLKQEMLFDAVTAFTAGTVASKPKVRESNIAVLQSLKGIMDKYYQDNPDDFVTVSESSTKPEHVEAWKMLPYETKQDIKKVFGTNGITVRKDSFNIVFGYHKYNISDAFRKDREDRNMIEQAVVIAARAVFGNKAANVLKVSQDVWTDVVGMAADMIVVKSFVVTFANTLSNLIMLKVRGVKLMDMAKSIPLVYKAAQDYQKASKRIIELDTLLSSDRLNNTARRAYEAQKARLVGDIQANPAKDLFDAGMLQNIEDVNMDQDNVILKRIPALDRISEKASAHVPSWLSSLARNAAIMRNSSTYSVLRDLAQMSDFTAKYALANHLSTRKKNPLPRAAALREAADYFIDYDLPSGRIMQSLNELGLVMFSKYLIRVQKHILSTLRDKPLQSAAMILGTDFLNIESGIADSLAGVATNPLSRLKDPLDVLELFDEGMYSRMVGI